jgi:CRP-like cAMP-binding protein
MTSQRPIALHRKLGSFVALSEDELRVLDAMCGRRRSFAAGHDVVEQGQSGQAAFILCEGWVCSYKIQRDGSRQIVDFQIPGDFLGLRSVLLRTSDHSFEPIAPISAVEVRWTDLAAAFATAPRLLTALLWALSRDEAVLVERLVGLGRREALPRVAHFLLELEARLALVGLGDPSGYPCPLTQYQLGDALGLSAIHVNRVLRELRESGLVTFRNGRVTFDDHARLMGIAEFDPAYLDQAGPLLP